MQAEYSVYLEFDVSDIDWTQVFRYYTKYGSMRITFLDGSVIIKEPKCWDVVGNHDFKWPDEALWIDDEDYQQENPMDEQNARLTEEGERDA